MRNTGWKYESARHALAARGIPTGRRYNYVPTYVAGDLPLIAGDAMGTAGASAVGLIPLVVPALLAYGGAKIVSKQLKRRKSRAKEKKKQHEKYLAEMYVKTPADYNPRRIRIKIKEPSGVPKVTMKTVHRLRLVPVRHVHTQQVPSKEERNAVVPGDRVAVLASGMGRKVNFPSVDKVWLRVVSKKRMKLIGRIEEPGRHVPLSVFRKVRFTPNNVVDVQRGHTTSIPPNKYMAYEDFLGNVVEEGDKIRQERFT